MRHPAYIEYNPFNTSYEESLNVLKCRMFNELGNGDLIHITNGKIIMDAEGWFILAVYQTK